jgi:hypothetical protein
MTDAPPKVHEVLAGIAAKWLESHSRSDSRIPRNPDELAHWWVDRQSPPNERFDRPVQQPKLDGSGMYWKTPYIDRIRSTLIKFLSLDSGFQGLIIAAAEDGIFWRGDSMEFFFSVISEREKMRAVGVVAYRDMAAKQAAAFVASKPSAEREAVVEESNA